MKNPVNELVKITFSWRKQVLNCCFWLCTKEYFSQTCPVYFLQSHPVSMQKHDALFKLQLLCRFSLVYTDWLLSSTSSKLPLVLCPDIVCLSNFVCSFVPGENRRGEAADDQSSKRRASSGGGSSRAAEEAQAESNAEGECGPEGQCCWCHTFSQSRPLLELCSSLHLSVVPRRGYVGSVQVTFIWCQISVCSRRLQCLMSSRRQFVMLIFQ